MDVSYKLKVPLKTNNDGKNPSSFPGLMKPELWHFILVITWQNRQFQMDAFKWSNFTIRTGESQMFSKIFAICMIEFTKYPTH